MDLVVDVLIFIEWKRPTQAHVHDDADRPHVQGAVVTLVEQDLWRQVGRRADHRAAERLLADDASEAKVAEFDLKAAETVEATDRKSDRWSVSRKTGGVPQRSYSTGQAISFQVSK